MNRLQTPQRPAPKGFSLLELLCAIFVISTGLTVALCGHFSSRDHLRENEARLMALTALENELETLRALPYSHLSTGAGQAFQSRNPMLDRLVDAACVTAIEEKALGPQAGAGRDSLAGRGRPHEKRNPQHPDRRQGVNPDAQNPQKIPWLHTH